MLVRVSGLGKRYDHRAEPVDALVDHRTGNVMFLELTDEVLAALDQHADALEKGALVTVDPDSSRVRILPIKP